MAVPRQFAHTVAKPRRRRDARDVGGDESPWNPSTLRADVLRTRSGGGEDQINAVDLVRRHQAVQIRRISSPEMAGDGRRISAKAAATTASRERGEELGFLREERGEAEWADRAQRVARVRPNPLGHLTAVYPAGKVFTWEEFTRKFRESNVPESIVELKRREFESLEQKDKAILTYVREFSKLSRYAVEEVNTEDKKKKRFLRGLSPQFKVQLRMMRATEFQELVDAAITLEDDFKQLQEEKRKKAKFEPKRAFRQDCKKPRIICFGCRQEGHMLKDCPKKNSGGGQSEEEETEDETPEATGRIRSPSAS
ncbi:hypothetical protein QYE76_026706 [Lolium multiflorum]|uniref:CCHC-type domain-containing protein n=1 Tax=Lolium multiflorum TaxID=4521 RepID=A0AAD8RJ92_LOLMU|nr:hypothetical protein QYE76_026706 [Lolium multiflorum]